MSNKEALKICRFLDERGLQNVVGLNLGFECSWASYLVIGTVTGRVQMQSSAKAVGKMMGELGLDVRPGVKRSEESSWYIIDGGDMVVSLMDQESRDFYSLEERWYEAAVLFPS